MPKIAIYGGSFDPPHYGHVMTIAAVLNSGLVDQVWLVPTGIHSDKDSVASSEERKAMVSIMLATMFGSREKVFLTDLQANDLSRISTTIDLLEMLQKEHPKHRFYPVIGSDLVPDLSKWHRAKELLQSTKFLVMPRPGFELKGRQPSYIKSITSASLALTNISSSMVRSMIKKRKSIEGIVPPAVISHLIRNKLYR